MTTEEKKLFRKCWANDKLPSDYGLTAYDYSYLSGKDWATMDGKIVFFED